MAMKKPIRGFGTLLVATALLLGAWPARAQVVITNVAIVNLTPSSFSLVASVSAPLPSKTNIAVSIFSDIRGVTSMAGQVGLELYPLNTGDPAASNSYQGLLSRTALRQESMALGLIYARVSACAPGVTYYYRISVTDSNGQTATWPPSGLLPSATTAQQTSFVVQSRQMLVTLDDAASPGTIITLSSSNTPSILAAVVGDGAAPNQAFFSVNDLIAASGDTNDTLSGPQVFTAEVLGSPSSGQTQTYDLIFSNTFSVGQSGDVDLGALSSTIIMGTGTMQAGGSGSVPISLASQSPLVNLSFTLSFPTNLLTATSVQATASALKTAVLSVISSNTIQLTFTAAAGQNFQGNQQIAVLNFTAAPNQPSAFVPLTPQAGQGSNALSIPTIFSSESGLAVIIGPRPLLQMQLAGTSRNLVLYGIPGQSYEIQSLTNLAKPGHWSNFMTVPMTNLSLVVPNLDPIPAAVFFRAYVLNADPPIVQVISSKNGRSLLTYGITGSNYTLQVSSNLSATAAWHPLMNYTLTNSFQYLTNLGAGSPNFYRVKKQ
jgi:hypothetical protein